MSNLKEIFERAQQTGRVEYTYFGGTNVSPFNQTSIPFGNDVDYGAGTSRRPYIKLGYDPAVKFRTDDPTNTYNTFLSSFRDTVRISRFLTDVGPGSAGQGALWLTKQTSLQISNPDTSIATVDGNNNSLTQITGPRLYNPAGANTIAQVASQGEGIHLTRHGFNPLGNSGYISLNTVDSNFVSRLRSYRTKLLNYSGDGDLVLNKYQGGPDSFYGIGNTTTTAYSDSFLLNTGETDKDAFFDGEVYNGFSPWSYSDIDLYGTEYDEGNLYGNGNSNKYIQDFRQLTNPEYVSNYPRLNIHNRIGVTTGRDAIGKAPNTVDSINILRITPSAVFYTNSSNATNKISNADQIYTKGYNKEATVSKTNGYYGRDIVKFRIEVLNNNNPTYDVADTAGNIVRQAPNTDVIAFRAYLDNLSDDFNATWKEFNYMGRGEPFYVYEKFKRTLNYSFYILAHSGEEMSSLYTKLNYLMSAMTPDYNKKLLMRGNYIYLTIGDYIYRQPGVVSKLSVTEFFKAPWEIALNDPENRNAVGGTADDTLALGEDVLHYEVPKYLKVTMDFTPIHDFLPRRVYSTETDWKPTFVTPNHRLYGTNGYNKYLPSEPTPNPPPPPKDDPKPQQTPPKAGGGRFGPDPAPWWLKRTKKQTEIPPLAPPGRVNLPLTNPTTRQFNTQDATRTQFSRFTQNENITRLESNAYSEAPNNSWQIPWAGFGGGGEGFNAGGAGGKYTVDPKYENLKFQKQFADISFADPSFYRIK